MTDSGIKKHDMAMPWITVGSMSVAKSACVLKCERMISTRKGLTDIAMKRYLTETDRVLNRFRIPLLTMTNEERALAMYAEDERLRNMSDLKDAATAAGMSDSTASSYIRKESEKTYLRSSDFGWKGGGPK